MHIVSSNDKHQANYNDFVKAQVLNDLEILYIILEFIKNLQFLQNLSTEFKINFNNISDIITDNRLKSEYFKNNCIVNDFQKNPSFKINSSFFKDKNSIAMIEKVMENIFIKLKKLDLPFNDQYLILNIFKYLTFILSENCEIFEFSYAKYLFKLLKYTYISKELARAKYYCICLEKISKKIKNPGAFFVWKAKIEFKSGNYMEAIKVLSKTNKANIKCRLKLFKYYLKSGFYSKQHVITIFHGFLKESKLNIIFKLVFSF